MIVTGLENQNYYINNPVFVNVSDLNFGLFVQISIGTKNYDFFYTSLQGKVQFDVSRLVRSISERVNTKRNFTLPTWNVDGAHSSRLILQDRNFNGTSSSGNPVIIDANFLEGGKYAYANNVPANSSLDVSNIFYRDYPNFTFQFIGGQIVGTELLEGSKSYDDVVYSDNFVNPLYVIFRNINGGFSSMLFEAYDKDFKGGTDKSYLLKSNIAVDRSEGSMTYIGHVQLKDFNYELARSLSNSDEVYLFNRGLINVSDNLIRVECDAPLVTNKSINMDFVANFKIISNFER